MYSAFSETMLAYNCLSTDLPGVVFKVQCMLVRACVRACVRAGVDVLLHVCHLLYYVFCLFLVAERKAAVESWRRIVWSAS